MFAVGIDISKSKSVAAILNQDGSMHTSPFEFHHTQPELDAFIKYILNSKQSATILMENTGHLSSSVYHTESHCKRAYVRRPQAAKVSSGEIPARQTLHRSAVSAFR